MELYILKSIFDNILFAKYNYLLEEQFIHSSSNEELSLIYASIKEWFARTPEIAIPSVDALEQHFYTCFSGLTKKQKALYAPVFDRLRVLEVDSEKVEEYLLQAQQKHHYRQIAETAIDLSTGRLKEPEKLHELFGRLGDSIVGSGSTHNSSLWRQRIGGTDRGPFENVNPSLEIHLPQKTLQRSLGPLRRGDFGVVVARPEVGKTAFVTHLVAYTLHENEAVVAYIANEERGAGIYSRIVSSFEGHKRQFQEPVSEDIKGILDKKLFLIHNPSIHYRELYKFLRELKPTLIIIDQLDKIQGFDEDRHDLILGKIYNWARQMAAEFGPVIGVSQASESAEGKRWLESSDLANSKTEKPAEADWILGIGKEHSEAMQNIRFFHLMKNKLEGDDKTIEQYRHGKFEMLLKSEMSRYEDIMKLD